MNHQSCVGRQAVIAHHDPSVRFPSCVFLSGEVQMDKGIFGLPILISACHERCREVKGSRLYSTILKFQLETPPPQNFTSLLAFARFRHPFPEISFRQLANAGEANRRMIANNTTAAWLCLAIFGSVDS